jgi:SAM-dependent methyltransferase
MSGFYAIIAGYYDSEHYGKDEDLPLYHALAENSAAPILIIGVGTGRIAFDLAEAGHEVHGIEAEPAMLERAQAKHRQSPAELRARVKLMHGDALKLTLEQQYGLVIIPYNTLMHFHSVDAHLGLLKRCRGWLAEGGTLVIDLPNAGESFAAQDTGAVVLERTFLERETGHMVMQHSVSILDRVRQIMEVTWIYDEITADHSVKRTVTTVLNRFFFFSELSLLLGNADFAVRAVYGDFDESEFVDGCPRMIVLAQAGRT